MRADRLLEDIVNGKRMTDEEFVKLWQEADFFALGKAADARRQKIFGHNLATFIIDRNINYTNICSCRCKFCAFYRTREAKDAYVIDREALWAKIEEAIDLGATQLMIQGGLNEELDITFFTDMFKDIKARYNITLHSLSAPEISFIAKISGLSIKETLLRLKEAGLDSLPGGGAEILHDDVRREISPNKISTEEWLSIMKTAHEIGLASTATMMMGSIEKLEHQLYHLHQIRDLQDQTGGFRAFIVWTYQPGNNMLAGDKISSLYYLRFLALSRLYLDNFKHIQGSWVTQGKEIGQLSLLFGADDLGSIMIEENVVRAAGTFYKMKKEEMISLIRSAGRIPAQRDTSYNILQIF
ncbi:de-hypoxanthine futalosine cyclase [Thermosyntropha lipolytica DSM 11003]|uniref:Cyclic dehypoxanthine futalosine synthase n=1 Tax=Thermosyntropha lipolytica DSM 11003 TaxID=1123382 RepID=A0A1M5LA96_9FIRM|nr:cyclic dehypoxanthinyl futalosine synthase [Thermosyntropha lipolytica]SHG61906.1 de-hypoxanthine futalosine cyclase [Thermosyntropha lipolytica DSM 11003]